MPTYEYKCDNCGPFEVERKITDKPLSNCPTCAGPVKRLISLPSIAFKGPGFHVTDYNKEKQKKDEKHQPEKPACNEAAKKEIKDTGGKKPS